MRIRKYFPAHTHTHTQVSFVKDSGTLFIIFYFIFLNALLFFLSRDLDGKGIVPYLMSKRFRLYF